MMDRRLRPAWCSAVSRRRWLGLAALGALTALGPSCTAEGGLFIPYVTTRSRKLEIKPTIDLARSTLTPGDGAVAVNVGLAEGGFLTEGKVKVRFHRQVGNITELGEDVWAEWTPGVGPGGAFVARTRFTQPGRHRIDVLAMSADNRRGEAQLYFDVLPAPKR